MKLPGNKRNDNDTIRRPKKVLKPLSIEELKAAVGGYKRIP